MWNIKKKKNQCNISNKIVIFRIKFVKNEKEKNNWQHVYNNKSFLDFNDNLFYYIIMYFVVIVIIILLYLKEKWHLMTKKKEKKAHSISSFI